MTTDIATQNSSIGISLDERLSTREKIQKLIDALDQLVPNCREIVKSYPLKHNFFRGVYMREIKLPAHHLVIGKMHRKENVTTIKSGMAVVVSENNPTPTIVKAGDQFIVPAYNANVILTFTDVVWTTIHPDTKATNVEDAETEIIVEGQKQLEREFYDYIRQKDTKCIERGES
jgi:hypothetical protein